MSRFEHKLETRLAEDQLAEDHQPKIDGKIKTIL